ncbi:MAG TPA: oligopeptide transporter, OPT family, partial [Candidatus Angelobacter sp.]
STTLAIFCGGIVRWLVEKAAERAGQKTDESDVSPGSLYASGLIAAGGIVGLLGIGVKLMAIRHWIPDNMLSFSRRIPALANAQWLSVLVFALLCFSLFYFARKPLESEKK